MIEVKQSCLGLILIIYCKVRKLILVKVQIFAGIDFANFLVIPKNQSPWNWTFPRKSWNHLVNLSKSIFPKVFSKINPHEFSNKSPGGQLWTCENLPIMHMLPLVFMFSCCLFMNNANSKSGTQWWDVWCSTLGMPQCDTLKDIMKVIHYQLIHLAFLDPLTLGRLVR